ncbi:MAG: biotin carboxylase N-terminal domain-containing protein [Pseudomonadota bacterium]
MKLPTFQTILVANRGEIALRIMRSARAMGMRTVAVYSEADADAPHRHAADQALCIGAAAPAASYLNSEAVLAAARRAGADAIHPGYGFLSENAGFAQACVDAGLTFIGPTAAAMQAMGNKAGAKRLMAAAGVPCVPGYQGADQSEARLVAEAAQIGYPVMIKAAAGGGGRGMRHVGAPADFGAALRSARSEAAHAFSSDELILEKAILEPRHIEIQICADQHGNVVHLGERDCSVQRRHQKLIEESPSPAVTPALRERMGNVAVAAARAIGYRGVGTLEFLLDGDGQFYFMEMNTRLQVEHAVTEAIAGVDLVEWQLRVALGAALPLTQQEIDARLAGGGHAIEVRLCAEDPQQSFLPQSGRIDLWRAPAHLRCDHALFSGMHVSPHYDSMLAKLVAHGRDRAEALRKLALGLEDCAVLGVSSNRHFLACCIAHKAFGDGHATTAFVDTHFPAAARARAPHPLAVPVAAVLLTWQRSGAFAGRYPAELSGWCSSFNYPQQCRFTLDGAAVAISVTASGEALWKVGQDGDALTIALRELGPHRLMLTVGGHDLQIDYAGSAPSCCFALAGVDHRAIDSTYEPVRRGAGGDGNGRISAPMNGRVVALGVAEGAMVSAGQLLLTVEAMKMEHSILAQADGKVETLRVALGAQVETGQLLIEIAKSPERT